MAITRLWFFALKPHTSFSDPAFVQLWTDVLGLCARYTPSPGPSTSQFQTAFLSQPCPKRAHHFLFQSTASTSRSTRAEGPPSPPPEPVYVLISSYPSFALCTQADIAYVQKFQVKMYEHVRNLAVRQLDMEDAEVVPALLASASPPSSAAPLSAAPGSSGASECGGADQGDEATVTVAISNSDPLLAEAMSCSSASLSGAKLEVPPPQVEISGADVYVIPLPPVRDGANGAREDLFKAQRGEGRKWIRIARGVRPRMEDIDVETYQLKELLAQ